MRWRRTDVLCAVRSIFPGWCRSLLEPFWLRSQPVFGIRSDVWCGRGGVSLLGLTGPQSRHRASRDSAPDGSERGNCLRFWDCVASLLLGCPPWSSADVRRAGVEAAFSPLAPNGLFLSPKAMNSSCVIRACVCLSSVESQSFGFRLLSRET